MKSFILDNRKRFLQALAIYQILGGISLIILMIQSYSSLGGVAMLVIMLMLAPMFGLCLLFIYAGYCYFRGRTSRFYLLTYFNLWLQVFQVTIPTILSFKYYYGPYLGIGIDGELDLLFRFEMLTSYFKVGIMTAAGFELMINFVPIGLLSIVSLIEKAPAPDPIPGFLEDESVS